MEDVNESITGNLDTIRKQSGKLAETPVDNQDHISTKRERAPSPIASVLNVVRRVGSRPRTCIHPEINLMQSVKREVVRSRSTQTPTSAKITPQEKQQRKQTLSEYKPYAHTETASPFARLSLYFKNLSTVGFKDEVDKTEIAKIKGMNKIRVAPEDLLQDDDWTFNFLDIRIKFPWLMINPYGLFKRFWEFFSLMLLFILLGGHAIRLCFESINSSEDDLGTEWLPFDITFDIFCYFDIIFHFFTAFENEEGILVTSRVVIAKTYLKTYFITDFLGSFPINAQILQFANDTLGTSSLVYSNYVVWRLIRLIKLLKVRKIFRQMDVCLTILKQDFERIKAVIFVLEVCMVVHLTACIWNIVGEVEIKDSWIDVQMSRSNSIGSKYLESIYFSLTVLLTVGYGNISANNSIERLILVIWMFSGVILYAYIIGSLSTIFSKFNETKTSKNERETFYTGFAKIFKIPPKLLDQILATIGMQYSRGNTSWLQVYQTNKLLVELPKSLHGEICTHVYRELIQNIEFFQNKPKHFLVRILPLLKPNNLSYGDEVYEAGDPSNEIFFIHSGRIASICHDRQGKLRSQIFVQGAYFGEGDIIYKRSRASTAFAESHVALWKLNKHEFLSILEEFPEVKKEVMALAQIKETYRAPLVNKTQSKVKEIQYAKKILTKSRTKRYEEMTAGDELVSPLAPKHSSQASPANEDKFGHLFSPLVTAKRSIKNIKKSPFGALVQSASIKALNKPIDLLSKAAPINQQNREIKEISLSRNLFREDITPKAGTSEISLNEIGASKTFDKSNFSIKSDIEQKRLVSDVDIKKILEQKAKKKLLRYLADRDCLIDDMGVIDGILHGKSNIEVFKGAILDDNTKIGEELDPLTEAESRLSSSIETYQTFLDELVAATQFEKS